MLENLASQVTIAEKIGQDPAILSWVASRIQRKEQQTTQNKQYSAEILAILLQSSPKNRTKFIEADGVDTLLQLLSHYRKRDPTKDSDEEEYVENLFDCLICLVDETDGKEKFVEGEGVELMLLMLKEGKFSKPRALRVLDHALGGQAGARACERLVESAGLRTVFGMFMKKVGGHFHFNLWIPARLMFFLDRVPSNRAFTRNIFFALTTASGRLSSTYSDTCQIHGKGI